MWKLPRGVQRGSATQRRHDAPSARLHATIITCRPVWPVHALPVSTRGCAGAEAGRGALAAGVAPPAGTTGIGAYEIKL